MQIECGAQGQAGGAEGVRLHFDFYVLLIWAGSAGCRGSLFLE